MVLDNKTYGIKIFRIGTLVLTSCLIKMEPLAMELGLLFGLLLVYCRNPTLIIDCCCGLVVSLSALFKPYNPANILFYT